MMQATEHNRAFRKGKVTDMYLPAGHGELILAVENEEMPRVFLQAVLRLGGYDVIPAADGSEAVQRYMEHVNEISLVLLDMGLPGISGEEVLSKIISTRPDARIVAAGGLIRPDARSAVIQLGAYDYMPKPYLKDELLQLVHDSLQSRAQAESCATTDSDQSAVKT